MCSSVGTLVATPIGNLEDVTLRALRVLREADLVLAEDTRRTRVLLDRHDIAARPRSLHAHNEATRTQEVLAALAAGASVALVSDAGTPLISDPGERLVAAAIAAGHEVRRRARRLGGARRALGGGPSGCALRLSRLSPAQGRRAPGAAGGLPRAARDPGGSSNRRAGWPRRCGSSPRSSATGPPVSRAS